MSLLKLKTQILESLERSVTMRYWKPWALPTTLLTGINKITNWDDDTYKWNGGYGHTTEFPVERWLRDFVLMTIGGGTSEVMAMVAARTM